MVRHHFWLWLFFFFAPFSAHAGMMEFGLTGNYRNSKFDEDNFQTTNSFTASLSYYFMEMSALELSYTNGSSLLSSKPPATEIVIYKTLFEMTSVDFVLTFAGRQAAFQPYIKFGGGYLEKELFRELDSIGRQKLGNSNGIVPSAGIGFKLMFTKTMRFKVGADAWTSPLNEEDDSGDKKPVTVDYAGRAGVSWFF